MKKFFSLVRLMFSQLYRIKPNGEKKKSVIATYIVLAICFLPMIIMISVGSFSIGKIVGNDAGVLASLLLGCQGLVVLFGTTSIMTIVFNGADSQKLLYMPIKSTTIFLARLTTVYINEMLTSLLVAVVAILPFGIGAGAHVGYFLTIPLACVLMPMLPLLIGCLFSMPISALLTKFRNNNIVRTIVQVLLFLAYFVIYGLFMFSSGETVGSEAVSGDAVQNLANVLKQSGEKLVYVHPDFMLATAMTVSTFGSWLLAILCCVAENAALLGIVVLVSLPFYRWILFASMESSSATTRKIGTEKLLVGNKGVVRELIVSDFKRVIRNNQLGFQVVASGIVMPILVVFMALVLGGDLSQLSAAPYYQLVAPFVIVVYGAMMCMGCGVLGLFPISRENKSLYLLKSLPVPFHKILLAKVVLAALVQLVNVALTCILVVIFFKVKWYFGIAMFLTMALLTFGGMCITTLLDLKAPKLGWENFNQSLKNSKNGFIAMLIGIICGIALGVVFGVFVAVYSVAQHWTVPILMWIVMIGLCAGFAAVSYKIMKNKSVAYFEKIEP